MKLFLKLLTASAIIALSVPYAAAINQQITPNLCWAACLEDVLNQARVPVSQGQLLMQFGNRPMQIAQVAAVLQGFGRRAWVGGTPQSPQELYGALATGWKLIAYVNPMGSTVGHFVVVEGADPNGALIVADPLTGATRPMSPTALFQAYHWMATVVVG
jgi:ABC-type bacteriocin/lantibiotic exporter with double-glycine peptidase domain